MPGPIAGKTGNSGVHKTQPLMPPKQNHGVAPAQGTPKKNDVQSGGGLPVKK